MVSALLVITIYATKSLMLNLCAIQIQFLNAWWTKFITSKRLDMGYRKHMFRVRTLKYSFGVSGQFCPYIPCRKAWKLDFWIQTKRVSRLSTRNIRAELTINNRRVLLFNKNLTLIYLNPMCPIGHRLKSKFAFQVLIYYCYIDITSLYFHFEVFCTNSNLPNCPLFVLQRDVLQ